MESKYQVGYYLISKDHSQVYRIIDKTFKHISIERMDKARSGSEPKINDIPRLRFASATRRYGFTTVSPEIYEVLYEKGK